MEEVQVISTSLIGSNGGNTCRNIEMTAWDLQYLLIDTIQKGLLFTKPENTTTTSLINHLKTTISHTLDFFPTLSGRFSTVKNADDDTTSFFITCNNSGAEFTHAVAPNLTVAEILDSCYVPNVVHSLFPLNKVRNLEGISKPLLGVQVTELVDGYFIGCTMNHSAGDGTCFWHFFNSWSEISRGSEFVSKVPVLNPWFPEDINPPIHLPLKLDDGELYGSTELPELRERIFHLTKESVAKLKAKANSEMGTQSISSLQAFMAHLWISFTRSRQIDAKEEVAVIIALGARPRLNPPLPEGYWGNGAYFKAVNATAGELLDRGLGWAALQMSNMVASQNNEQVIKFYKDWVENPLLFRKDSFCVGNKLVISSSPRFSVYSSDFGWGEPVAVRSGMANKGDGKVTLFPGVEQGSVDIEVCNIPQTLQAMENDADFMEFVTV